VAEERLAAFGRWAAAGWTAVGQKRLREGARARHLETLAAGSGADLEVGSGAAVEEAAATRQAAWTAEAGKGWTRRRWVAGVRQAAWLCSQCRATARHVPWREQLRSS